VQCVNFQNLPSFQKDSFHHLPNFLAQSVQTLLCRKTEEEEEKRKRQKKTKKP
jgi:hypothetical protein